MIGDIGYQTGKNTKKRLAKVNATIITPYKSNQKMKNTVEEKQKLKTRSAIERKFPGSIPAQQ